MSRMGQPLWARGGLPRAIKVGPNPWFVHSIQKGCMLKGYTHRGCILEEYIQYAHTYVVLVLYNIYKCQSNLLDSACAENLVSVHLLHILDFSLPLGNLCRKHFLHGLQKRGK